MYKFISYKGTWEILGLQSFCFCELGHCDRLLLNKEMAIKLFILFKLLFTYTSYKSHEFSAYAIYPGISSLQIICRMNGTEKRARRSF